MIRVYRNGWKHTIGIIITIRNGSFFETKKQEGYTHIAEHLMFSGTKRFDRYMLRDKHEELFYDLEATTAKEEVNLFCYIDKEDVNEALHVLHEMIFDWRCRPDIFQDEKKDGSCIRKMSRHGRKCSAFFCKRHMKSAVRWDKKHAARPRTAWMEGVLGEAGGSVSRMNR